MVRGRVIGGLLALFAAMLPAGPAAADVDRAGGNGAHLPGPAPMRATGPRAPAAVTGVRVTAVDGGLRVSWRPAGDFGSGTFVVLPRGDVRPGVQVCGHHRHRHRL